MIEWLLAPIDAARGHDLGAAAAWHGRLMVLAWAVLLPIGVIVARFFKVTARQNWPAQLDNKAWWIAHQASQYIAAALIIGALWLIWRPGIGATDHAVLGWLVVVGCALQILGAWVRGSKGGPTEPRADGSLRGDHYDMTSRRRLFERVHKSLGYLAILVSVAAILSGLWLANAPRWMWLMLTVWWLGLISLAMVLQARGKAIDTYQAIWGPDPAHPGNRVPPIGWGVRRPPVGRGTANHE